MSSIIEAILKATVGLLVNKGRDAAAKKLKDGDVADQEFRKLVVRELDDIKFKIDGLARKDLLASVSFLKEGLVFLYQLLDHPELREFATATARAETEEKLALSLPSAKGGSRLSIMIKPSSLVEELKMLKLNELNETASKQLLADAKKKFEKAQDEATRAFSNEGLQLSDRILATKIRIMATLMEKVDNPLVALPSCRLFLEELHNIPSVQNCFEVEITKPFMKYRFNMKERREIIAEVCYMNFVVYSVTRMVSRDWRDLLPTIGKLKIDPLRDGRLNEALSEFSLERCCLRERTFGQEGEENHRLVEPISITTNTQGQFIVADLENVKVFDPSGMFLRSLCPLTKDEGEQLTFYLHRVATDGNDNLYVLVSLTRKTKSTIEWSGVYVFDKHNKLHYKFPIKESTVYLNHDICELTVSNDGKVVLVLVYRDNVCEVDVYQTDGRFAYSFGRGKLSNVVRGLSTAHDRVMVLDGYNRCVQVYNTQGDHLHEFAVQGNRRYGGLAFHQPSEHVIVSSTNPDDENHGQVSIYTKDGEFVRSVELNTDKKDPWLSGLTVTVDRRVAVTNLSEDKVHIISF